MRHWKKVNNAEYRRIKTLTDAKLPISMIVKATKRSYPVVQAIERSQNLESYHTLINAVTNGVRINKKQSKDTTESFGNVKPEERFPRIVTLLDTIVKQQTVLLQDMVKIKKRLFITQ